jgi:hypothetical protein
MMHTAGLCAELKADIAALRSEIRLIELRRQVEIEVAKGQAAWRRLVSAFILWMVVNAVGVSDAMFGLAKVLGY